MTSQKKEFDQYTYWLNRFKETENTFPSCEYELMQYAAIMTQQSKEHASFWKGVFGL